MAKPKRGKKLGNTTYHRTSGGMRKLNCPHCKRGVAVDKRMPNGTLRKVCSVCGRGFESQRLQP